MATPVDSLIGARWCGWTGCTRLGTEQVGKGWYCKAHVGMGVTPSKDGRPRIPRWIREMADKPLANGICQCDLCRKVRNS